MVARGMILSDDPVSTPALWQSRTWRSADGLALHARDYPAADGAARLPVICLHGLTRNARDFERLAPWLAAMGRRVLAVDVRGRGGSARDPAADYRLPTYAADVVRLMAALGLARAVFVGTSMGGLIAMELAALRPDLIQAAIVNDVGPELGAAGLARIAGYAGKAAPVVTWEDAARYVEAQNAAALPHYAAADWARMARRMFREQDSVVVADYDPGIAKPFADAPRPIEPWDRWRALVADRPVLLLRGALSDLLEADAARRMTAAGGDVTLAEVPAVGHAPMLDEPAALAAIDGFLDRVA